jgi:hypothetical protein
VPTTCRGPQGLPLGSGMGSSAASAAAAAWAVNGLFGAPLSKAQLVLAGLASEAAVSGYHADNIGPALLGGFVLIRWEAQRMRTLQTILWLPGDWNPTGWTHTIQIGELNCWDPEASHCNLAGLRITWVDLLTHMRPAGAAAPRNAMWSGLLRQPRLHMTCISNETCTVLPLMWLVQEPGAPAAGAAGVWRWQQPAAVLCAGQPKV